MRGPGLRIRPSPFCLVTLLRRHYTASARIIEMVEAEGSDPMKMALTLDDLPLWPMSYPPADYTVAGMVEAIVMALDRHGIRGVYAFAIIESWTAAGHHVANHTHSHIELNDVSVEAYIADIELGESHLSSWLAKAPQLYFGHPLCYWGDTQEKRDAVRSHLSDRGYRTVDVTS